MAFHHDRTTESQSTSGLSRRELLRRGALAGAALYPGIALLSNSAHGEPSSSSSIAEYELNVAPREAQPDGRSRQIWCYNGQLPGPLLRARLGQKFRIKVVNHLPTATSVHWHGLHQPGTWQMDGVDKVSREPIPPGQSFVYEFDATPAGTHWYHSHVGVQYANGLIGPLIIDENTPPARYDRDEILFINDWFLRPAEKILASLVGPSRMSGMPQKKGMSKKGMSKDRMKEPMQMDSMKTGPMKMGTGIRPDIADVPFESALFNGLGRFRKAHAPLTTPLTTLHVKPGETLRLRLINGSSTYQFRVQIDGHAMTVIAADGAPVTPVTVDNLLFSPGERYDVLVKADRPQTSWIRAATLAGDEALAILHCGDAPQTEPAPSPVMWGKRALALDALRSPEPPPLDPPRRENQLRDIKPREVVLRMGGTMQPYAWNINDEEYPHAEPIPAAKDEWLRFVLDNPTGMDHPFHLHGHYFYVLGKPDKLNLTDPPRKDTINVPANSRLVLLWQANNPGHWFFHCHIEWHAATGMARVIEIAEH